MAFLPRSEMGRKALEWGGISLVAIVVGLVIGGALGGSPPDEGVELSAGSSSTTSTSSTVREVTPTTAGSAALSTSSTTTSTAPVTVAPPARAASAVKVKLYNGSSVGGAAVVAGNELKAVGYAVQAPGPSTGARAESSVWHKPGFEGEAAAVADALGASGSVVALLPDPSPVAGVGNADVVVVVGDDVAAS